MTTPILESGKLSINYDVLDVPNSYNDYPRVAQNKSFKYRFALEYTPMLTQDSLDGTIAGYKCGGKNGTIHRPFCHLSI